MQMDELAREVGLSRPHFFKLFKMQMGITPNLYLNTLRAEHAIEDLMTTVKVDHRYRTLNWALPLRQSFTRFLHVERGHSAHRIPAGGAFRLKP